MTSSGNDLHIPSISSTSDFQAFVKKTPEKVTVVHFWASWSEACRQMNEVMMELAKESDGSKLQFVQLEAESAPEVSLQYDIIAVPTFIFLKNEEKFDRLDGAYAAELTKKVRQYKAGSVPLIPAKPAASHSEASEVKKESKDELNSRLKRLIDSHKCMVFMKGSPEAPKCGFSKQLIGLLDELNADYGTFDILRDESVRGGLKEYSDWPTYPQLYVDGELIGGLDIIKEMKESGDLEDILPKKFSLKQRLEDLVRRERVMIFMKGDPSGPKCKFSRALMEIMSETGVKFGSFDVLEDEGVRQGLKEFSNWPTYPQVYVNGELIGGIDIIKELKESGELTTTLSG